MAIVLQPKKNMHFTVLLLMVQKSCTSWGFLYIPGGDRRISEPSAVVVLIPFYAQQKPNTSGQIIIFQQPRFPWNKGVPSLLLIWPEQMVIMNLMQQSWPVNLPSPRLGASWDGTIPTSSIDIRFADSKKLHMYIYIYMYMQIYIYI